MSFRILHPDLAIEGDSIEEITEIMESLGMPPEAAPPASISEEQQAMHRAAWARMYLRAIKTAGDDDAAQAEFAARFGYVPPYRWYVPFDVAAAVEKIVAKQRQLAAVHMPDKSRDDLIYEIELEPEMAEQRAERFRRKKEIRRRVIEGTLHLTDNADDAAMTSAAEQTATEPEIEYGEEGDLVSVSETDESGEEDVVSYYMPGLQRGKRRRQSIPENYVGMLSQDDLDVLANAERPLIRGDCLPGGVNADRPCPFVSCKYHLYASMEDGQDVIELSDIEVDQLKESCALDMADKGPCTLESVGAVLGVTRDRIRQLETKTLSRLEYQIEKVKRHKHLKVYLQELE